MKSAHKTPLPLLSLLLLPWLASGISHAQEGTQQGSNRQNSQEQASESPSIRLSSRATRDPRQETDDELSSDSIVSPTRDLVTAKMIDEELDGIAAAELSEEVKSSVQKHYLDARQFLTLAESEKLQTEKWRAEATGADESFEATRRAIDEFDPEPDLPFNKTTPPEKLPSLESLQETKRALDQEIVDLEQELEVLQNLDAKRRTQLLEIPELQTEAETRLAEVQRQLAVEAPDVDEPVITRSRMLALRAEQQKLKQRLELLRAERDAYEQTDGLPDLKADLRARQLDRATRSMEIVQFSIGELQKKEATNLVQEAVEKKLDTSTELAPIAERNVELSDLLQKKTLELQNVTRLGLEGKAAVRKVASELNTMQTRVEAVGLSYDVGEMLRRDRTELLKRQPAFTAIDCTTQLRDVQLSKFQWEDEKAELINLEDVAKRIAVEVLPPETKDDENKDDETKLEKLEVEAADLLRTQSDLLEKLRSIDSKLYNELFAVRTSQAMFTKRSQEFASFLEERILWVRSGPAVGFGDLSGIHAATAWLVMPQNWIDTYNSAIRSARNQLPATAMILVGLLGLMLLQPRSRFELKSIGAVAAKRGCRNFRVTVSGLLQTVVLAIFWPAVGMAVGWLLTSASSTNPFTAAIGRAFTITAAISFPFELMRCVCKKEGLAENHFDWSEGFRIAIRKHTGWFLLCGLPLVFLMVAFSMSGSPEFSRLGRLAMLVLLTLAIVYFWKIFSVFRIGGASYVQGRAGFSATVDRLRSIVFYAVMLGLLSLIVFAGMGYYESAFKIGTSLTQTMMLLIVAVVLFAMALRFLLVRRRRLRFDQLTQQRKAAIATAEKQAELGKSVAAEALDIDLQNEAGMDITDVSRQARELTGVIFLIAIGLTLLGIWQYLLPATKILDSWVLWRITIGTGVESVTARDLLLSMVAFALTFFGVRNIPGMLELLLLQRLPLDAGARYAVASIFRYILLVVGVIVALGYLKIPWSNYSWLVAAISVGLGFGLQEIVANFVSGLILLLERPVRVGDVVTIDGVTGVVSRIQMRATTVTNWDNQELVVPNKDLISGKLLNWTLSNVINRIALKFGVAYGSDVKQVRELVTKIVDRHPDVMKEPAPFITFEEFGDSSLNFVIRCCTTSISRRWHLVDEINSAVNEAFEREGIEIPFPQRVVHTVDGSAER